LDCGVVVNKTHKDISVVQSFVDFLEK